MIAAFHTKQQVRQLRDIDCDPSRFVFRKQLGR
jgi:hypothetical protein